MEQWCVLFAGVIPGLAGVVTWLLSLALDNVPGLREWWEGLAGGVKRAILFALTVAVGVAAYFAGDALACPGWPDLATALYAIFAAALGTFWGGKRHEKAKRAQAEWMVAAMLTEERERHWKAE